MRRRGAGMATLGTRKEQKAQVRYPEQFDHAAPRVSQQHLGHGVGSRMAALLNYLIAARIDLYSADGPNEVCVFGCREYVATMTLPLRTSLGLTAGPSHSLTRPTASSNRRRTPSASAFPTASVARFV